MNEIPKNVTLALQASRRAVKNPFLSGEAYDYGGIGRARWETHDEFCQSITDKNTD